VGFGVDWATATVMVASDKMLSLEALSQAFLADAGGTVKTLATFTGKLTHAVQAKPTLCPMLQPLHSALAAFKEREADGHHDHVGSAEELAAPDQGGHPQGPGHRPLGRQRGLDLRLRGLGGGPRSFGAGAQLLPPPTKTPATQPQQLAGEIPSSFFGQGPVMGTRKGFFHIDNDDSSRDRSNSRDSHFNDRNNDRDGHFSSRDDTRQSHFHRSDNAHDEHKETSLPPPPPPPPVYHSYSNPDRNFLGPGGSVDIFGEAGKSAAELLRKFSGPLDYGKN
jgi:hypothetical protein